MAGIDHELVAVTPDDPTKEINPSDWNGDHVIRGDVDFDGHKITNIGAPVADDDAATKEYVDDAVAAGGGSFSPLDIDDCVLWLDASDATTINAGSPSDDDPVSAWADKSASNFDAAMADADHQPVYKTSIRNGKGVIRFDPAGDPEYLDLATAGDIVRDLAGCTVIVMSGNGNASLNFEIDFYASIGGDPTYPRLLASKCGYSVSNPADDDGFQWYAAEGGERPSVPSLMSVPQDPSGFTNGLGTWASGFAPWAIRCDWTSGGAVQVQLGHAALSPTWGWLPQAGSGTPDTASALVRVGGNDENDPISASAMECDLGELIVYARCLTSRELRQVFDYLSDKWATL